MNLQTIIFIGKSGSGKGTQVKKIIELIKNKDSENREIFQMESGQKFRDFIDNDNYSSKLSRKVFEEGRLQPAFLSTWVWASQLIDRLDENMHLLIDGTPRRMPEAKMLESALKFYERENVKIVHLNISREEAIKRMTDRGREDDVVDNINSRLDWFDEHVLPIVEFYKEHEIHKCIEVDGEQSIDEIHNEIVEKLDLK